MTENVAPLRPHDPSRRSRCFPRTEGSDAVTTRYLAWARVRAWSVPEGATLWCADVSREVDPASFTADGTEVVLASPSGARAFAVF